MQIKFGMYLDGARWNAGNRAVLGKITVGPQQFATMLESFTVLDGVKTSVPCRINEYMQKMAQQDSPWCRQSFSVDPWATAKKLLEWRDEMFEAGWDGKSAASERQKTIAQLETFENSSDALTDRLLNILNALDNLSFPHEITLDEPFDDLPYLWREILKKLENAGAKIIPCSDTPLLSPSRFAVCGNDEVVLARVCARYLASTDNSRTAVICEGNSAILDEAFHQAGLGRIGITSRSCWRESLQLLPLWLETLWKPFDPARFIQLLVIPDSPVPSKLARALAAALEDEPGFGGEAWHNAWQKIELAAETDPDILTANMVKCHEILDNNSFIYEESVPVSEIIGRCNFFCKVLSGKKKNNEELSIPLAHANTLKEIMLMRRNGDVRRQELYRIIDSIISSGTEPDVCSEVTDFAVFTNPAMVDETFDTVIWWNFVSTPAVKQSNWSEAEKAFLPHLDGAAVRRRENRSWNNILRKTSKNLILMIPAVYDGEESAMHPFGDELKLCKEEKVTVESLISPDGKWLLADRSAELEKAPAFVPSDTADIPENDIDITGKLSPTTMENIISCPRKWYFEKYLRLKTPSELNISSGPLMMGKLAHKIVENIYSGKSRLDENEAYRLAAEEFDRLAPSMAAELLQPGNSVECKRQKKILTESVKQLAKELNDRQLTVVGNETEHEGSFYGIDFYGIVDLELRDAEGNLFIIDMKWSYSKDYDDKISSGKAIQLAVYSAIANKTDSPVKCAYYIFPKKKLEEADTENPVDWAEIRQKSVTAWREALETIRSGKVPRGFTEDELDNSTSLLPIAAQCKYCPCTAWCKRIVDEEEAEVGNE
jgi:RecB family exonuclease